MKHALKLTIAVAASCLASLVFAADTTTSMRGVDVSAASTAPQIKEYAGKRPGTEEPVARTFSTQPPVIPHAVENFDEINLEENQCMDCHSAATYKKKKAPKMGDSHFVDRDGKKHADATGGRYSCVLCHVPQVDAPPLVDNTFTGDDVTKTARKK